MEPVPYEIREDDVDEVLDAYEPVGGGRFPEEDRKEIRAHVMGHVGELDEIVRVAPELDEGGIDARVGLPGDAGPIDERPGDLSSARRELALGAIEDLLIREGVLELDADESRTFPPSREHDTERDDG